MRRVLMRVFAVALIALSACPEPKGVETQGQPEFGEFWSDRLQELSALARDHPTPSLLVARDKLRSFVCSKTSCANEIAAPGFRVALRRKRDSDGFGASAISSASA